MPQRKHVAHEPAHIGEVVDGPAEGAQAPTTPAKPSAGDAGEVVFTSEHGNLILYGGVEGPIARFVGGEFRTSDPAIIAALRGHELVQELEA